MEYKKINLNSYNIHFIKTDIFKTIEVRVVFCDEFSKEEISKRNFLFDILVNSTKNYPTKRLLSLRCQELYSMLLSTSNFRIGNYLFSKVGLSFLNPKYTEESMLEDSLGLLFEVLFNPLVDNSRFISDDFNRIKKELLNEIETIKEQPRIYAVSRMLEEMGVNEPYRYHGYCYASDLEKITEESLYDYYKQILNSNLVDVFVVGDFDFDKMEKIIRENLQITTIKRPKKDIFVKHDKFRKRIRKVIETGNYQQSKLSVGLKIKEMTEFEMRYVSGIYNLLLGGIGDSLLMQNVREKASLAYYATSSINKVDNIIMINCGINGNNLDKTLQIIKKTLKQIENGGFSEEDIKKCQFDYLSSLDTAMTNSVNIIDLKLSEHLGLTDDIETRKEQIMRVTKKDIIDYSKKVLIDTVYLLKGE